MTYPDIRAYWDKPSIVWGKPAGSGEPAESISPLGGISQTYRLLDARELESIFQPGLASISVDVLGLLEPILSIWDRHREALIESIQSTTGFSARDSSDLFEGCRDLLRRWEPPKSEAGYCVQSSTRSIRLESHSYGLVAAILPQNAFEFLALTCLLNGWSSGNRIVVRAPGACARSAGILGQILLEAGVEPQLFSMVVADAGSFLDSAFASGERPLIHFMGSSARIGELAGRCFAEGCPFVADGDGNTMVFVDADVDPVDAARTLWEGAMRFNGQTCTSIVGAVLHPAVDGQIRQELRSLLTQNGSARCILFSERQAQHTENAVRSAGGRIHRLSEPNANRYPPTLLEDPSTDSSLVREGVFAPVLWIRSGDADEFAAVWRRNRYPLCAGLLSNACEPSDFAAKLPHLARLVVNGDPSNEDAIEPWGGYGGSAINPVGHWADKYRRVVQIDEPAR